MRGMLVYKHTHTHTIFHLKLLTHIKNYQSFNLIQTILLRPERWLKTDPNYEKIHPFVHLPFGHGPRMCIGRRFAELETSILMLKVIRKFTVQWQNPELKMKTETITKPAGPLNYTFIDR